jgi:hypothetical protein
MIGIKRLRRKTAEIVVNKPKLLAHEDDNTTSSFLELQKKDIVLIYLLKLIDEGHDIHELYAQSAKMILVLSLLEKI